MQNLPDKLPDDINSLKELVTQQASRNAQLITENQQYKTQILSLQEQLNLALARRYAASSEKLSPDQLRLFTEAEADNDLLEEDNDDVINIPAHSRKKSGRKALPKTLPRVDVIHDIPESDRICPHDGAVLQEMNKVISEQLDIIPARIQVIRHIRKQYACGCGQCIKIAPLPAQPIPKSLASPGLLAHVTVSKYQDALPLYRQEQILQRIGVELPRATLANWMIQAGQLIQPVINLLREQLLASDIIQMDDDYMDAGGRATQEQLPRPRYRYWMNRINAHNPNPTSGYNVVGPQNKSSFYMTMIQVADRAYQYACWKALRVLCRPMVMMDTTRLSSRIICCTQVVWLMPGVSLVKRLKHRARKRKKRAKPNKAWHLSNAYTELKNRSNP